MVRSESKHRNSRSGGGDFGPTAMLFRLGDFCD